MTRTHTHTPAGTTTTTHTHTPTPLDPIPPPAYIPTLDTRPYQLEGARWLLTTRRAILADQQGLGKTATALLATAASLDNLPALIIAPSFWTPHWHRFITTHLPHDSIIDASAGTRTQRLEALDLARTLLRGPLTTAPTPHPNYLIISAEMIPLYQTQLSHITSAFRTIIVDEAHMFRSHRAKRAQILARQAAHTPNLYLLTATPQMSDPDDYYQLLHILHPTLFTSYYRFLDQYLRTQRLTYKVEVIGLRDPHSFSTMLKQYMLRRTYTEVGRQLPPVLPTTILQFSLTPEEQHAYRQLKDNYISQGTPLESAGQVLHQLRMLTARQKPQIVTDLLKQEHPHTPPPYIIFCWYKETAQQVAKHITQTFPAHPPLLITGDTPPNGRTASITQTNVTHIVATIASMSVGVDLSKHKLLIFAEETYTPGQMDQAYTRVIRDTHDNNTPVRPYVIRASRSVDMAVARAQRRRNASIQSIMKEVSDNIDEAP